jgi:hypothetical protein
MDKKTRPKKAKTAKVKKKKRNKQRKSPLSLVIIVILLAVIAVLLFRTFRQKEVTPDLPEIARIEDAIKHAADQLGVPDDLYRTSVRDDGIYIFITLDRERVDLVFANMIITGQVEMAGGEIVSGTETSGGSVHTLRIRDKEAEKDFIVRLTFDRQSRYPEKGPRLAIIVDDFGEFAGSLLDGYLETDPNVTFAILPGLRHTRTVLDRALSMGREVILHIPMEPVGYPRNNPGDNPILVEQSEREINRILEGHLRQLPGVLGANNHMGSLATADERVMTVVLGLLAKHGLYFVDSRTTPHTIAVEVGQRMHVPVTQRDLFLDDPDSSEATMRERLAQLRNLKEQKDQVVVITHCFDRQRLNILNKFIIEAQKMGFEIVPVSQLFITDLPEIL